MICLKSSPNRKDLNNFTASPFSVAFLVAGNWEKDTKNRAAVKSLKSFLFCNDFNMGDTYMQDWQKKWQTLCNSFFQYFKIEERGGYN